MEGLRGGLTTAWVYCVDSARSAIFTKTRLYLVSRVVEF